MSKHTEGPWLLSSSGPTVYALHGNPPRNRFSTTLQSGRSDDAPHAELDANARLISASPELLESVQEFVAWMDAPSNSAFSDKQMARARAAIAKATGGAA